MNYELEIKDTSNVDLSEDEELNYNNIYVCYLVYHIQLHIK